MFIMNIGIGDKNNSLCWRPYRVECTGSLPTSEVKRRRARLVLGWGAAREDLRVLPAFDFQGFVAVSNRGANWLGHCQLNGTRSLAPDYRILTVARGRHIQCLNTPKHTERSDAMCEHCATRKGQIQCFVCRCSVLKDQPIQPAVAIVAGGHTASNAPDLFRPPKLSGAGPG